MSQQIRDQGILLCDVLKHHVWTASVFFHKIEVSFYSLTKSSKPSRVPLNSRHQSLVMAIRKSLSGLDVTLVALHDDPDLRPDALVN